MKNKIFALIMCITLICSLLVPITVLADSTATTVPSFENLPDNSFDTNIAIFDSESGSYVVYSFENNETYLEIDYREEDDYIVYGYEVSEISDYYVYFWTGEIWQQYQFSDDSTGIYFPRGALDYVLYWTNFDLLKKETDVNGNVSWSTYHESDVGKPDMDTPETNGKTLPKGLYTFYDIDELIFPSYEITQELNYNVPYYSLATGFVTMEYDTMTLGTNVIVYEKDGSTTIACKGVPFAQVGWVTEHYKTIYLAEPQTVSEDFEGWFWTLVANYENAEPEEPEPEPEPQEGIYADIYGLHVDGVTYGYGGYAANMNSSNYLVTHNPDAGEYTVYAVGDNNLVFSTDQNFYSITVGSGTPYVVYFDNGTIKTTGTMSGAYDNLFKVYFSGLEDYKTNGVVYSTKDIVDSSGNTFFQQTPLAEKSGTLTEIIKAETLTGVLREIAIILPIGMACLISYLALRKGLRTLVQLLSRA